MEVAHRCYGLVPPDILNKLYDMFNLKKLTVGDLFVTLRNYANELPAVIAAEMNFLKNGLTSNSIHKSAGPIIKRIPTIINSPTPTPTTSPSVNNQTPKPLSSPRSVDSDVYDQENSQARITDITKTLNPDGKTYTTTENTTTVAVGDG